MRDRFNIPVLLPLLGVGAILLTIFSFGYVLLQVQETRQAWPVAIAVASAILLIAAFLNWQPSLRGWPVYALTAAPASVILAIGMFFLIRPSPGAEGGPAVAAIPPPGPLQEVGTDNKFSNTSFTILVGQQYTLNFDNKGAALHNWHLQNVTGADGQPVATKLLNGGQSESISFTVAQPGDYTFICDVHPTEMRGMLAAVTGGTTSASAGAGGASTGGGSPGPGTIAQVATDNKFSQTALNANANEPTTLSLENRGSALHNLHITGVNGSNGQPIVTKLLPGGQSESLQFTIAQAGSYNFLCDVHPTEMKGTLTVK